MPKKISTVIFDLGQVLLEWQPERAFEQVLQPDEVAAFMEEIGFTDFNYAHDAGQDWRVGEQDFSDRFPHRVEAIRAYRKYFDLTLTGMVPGTGALVAELGQANVRLVALTNWSAELFPYARRRFGILDRFEDIVVSGEVKLAKPDPAIFRWTLEHFDLEASSTLFIDDSARNCAAAEALGITAVNFVDAESTRAALVDHGLLGPRGDVPAPIFHLAERTEWQSAQQGGSYPWSSRDLTYERQGFVHCSYRHQVQGVLDTIYADVDHATLVLLEVDPARLTSSVIAEDLDAGQEFPHIYGPLDVSAVVAEHDEKRL